MKPFIAQLLLVLSVTLSGAQTSSPVFEVASVKPAPPDADPKAGSWSIPGTGSFTATHLPLIRLIMLAYDVDSSQVANKPDWFDTNLYDVSAKPEDGVRLTREALRPRLRALLQQRFHLVTHTEMRPTSGYALVIAKGGPHLATTKGDYFPGFRTNVSPGHMSGFNWSMPVFAKYLTPAAGFPVADQTGLKESYDISFDYAPDSENTMSTQSTLLPLQDAVRQATGLLLKPQKVEVETIVIDSVGPLENEN